MDRGPGPVPPRASDGTAFATKPQLALPMLTRALDARIPASWLTGDEVYGADPRITGLQDIRQIRYVLAVAKLHAQRPPRPCRCACRHAGQEAAAAGLAAAVGRSWRQGTPVV